MRYPSPPVHRTLRPLALAAALGTLSACTARVGAAPDGGPEPTVPQPIAYEPVSPALPPIPAVEGPLAIRVVHPTPGTPRPRVDSTFVYGSVGTGGAALVINGTPVAVAPNGAFLAYLPVPESGVYELTAYRGGERATATASYLRPGPGAAGGGAPARPADVVFESPRLGTVTGVADTLATGSGVAIGRPTPTGTYRWFFPRGARLTVLERRGDQYRVRLAEGTDAWVGVADVALAGPGSAPAPARLGEAALRRVAGGYELRVPAGGAPFRVEAGERRLDVVVYGDSLRGLSGVRDAFVTGFTQAPAGPGAVRLGVQLAADPWGYKAWYEPDGTLVVRLREPPRVDPAAPLRGARIALDPGHPPAGATGPTGLTEGEANLAIARSLADQLRQRGAEVLLTRSENVPVGLAERTRMAAEWDADLLISVHNNAFPEGVNPFRRHGTSTYYFHPFSAAFARALNREIVGVTRIPDLGARESNLALVRPTWFPSALTESLYMLIPEQEAALRDPAFVERLAAAHLRGIEAFLRERGSGAAPSRTRTP